MGGSEAEKRLLVVWTPAQGGVTFSKLRLGLDRGPVGETGKCGKIFRSVDGQKATPKLLENPLKINPGMRIFFNPGEVNHPAGKKVLVGQCPGGEGQVSGRRAGGGWTNFPQKMQKIFGAQSPEENFDLLGGVSDIVLG